MKEIKKSRDNRDSNQVIIHGRIKGDLKLSHESYGEKFYTTYISVNRMSGTPDVISIVISEYLARNIEDGIECTIYGSFRSRNEHDENGKSHLLLFVFASDLVIEDVEDKNSIMLNGYTCKPGRYRTTPKGRNITDITLAVNSSFGKANYIPCICWGRNAKMAGLLDVGEKVIASGRIQSRVYRKVLENDVIEERVAYEVSVVTIQIASEVEENEED